MTERRVKVWDLPTRLFHWGLVISIAGAWWTAENEDFDTHLLFGYVAFTLILFRLAWGVFGGDTAKFATFVKGPRAAVAHLRDLLKPGIPPSYVGHNPLGGYSVLLLLALVAVQVATGLFLSGGDIFVVAGPLNDLVDIRMENRLAAIHEVGFDVMLVASALHVLAIAYYALAKRRDLLTPMITGTTRVPEQTLSPGLVSPLRALAIIVAAAGFVWLLSLRD